MKTPFPFTLLWLLFWTLALTPARATDRGEILSGETRAGAITAPSSLDTWTFTGNAGDRVIINAVTTNGTLGTAIVLYPPSGPAEASTHDCCTGGGDQLDWQIQTNGIYTIVIEDNGFVGTGNYKVTLLKIPGTVSSAADPDGGAINPGETLSGGIQSPSDMDAFQFTGNAGDRVIINAVTTNGTLGTAILLYPPNGEPAEVSTHNCCTGGGDQLDWQIQTNGIYTIVIEDNGLSATGNYKLPGTVTSATDADGAIITSGQSLTAQIQTPSDMDAFQVYGNAGDRVIINAVTVDGSLGTAIVLYPPNGGPAEVSTHN